jgi:hypothetical protein
MASGKSLTLALIPKRTRQWVHQHVVKDHWDRGRQVPVPANRRERRLAERGRPWYGGASGSPRFRPQSRAIREDGDA